MSRWNKLERLVVPFAGAVLTAVSLLCAQEPAKAPRASAPAVPRVPAPGAAKSPPASSPAASAPASGAKSASTPGAPQESADVAEIRATARAYLKAVHDRDYRAAATFWNPAGDYIDGSGQKHNMHELFAQRLRANPSGNSNAGGETPSPEKSAGATSSVGPRGDNGERRASDVLTGEKGPSEAPAPVIGTLRLLTPDVAIEDGSWSTAGEDRQRTAHNRFTAVWTRSQGKWRLDSLRESRLNDESPAERLAALDWLVGQWDAPHGSLLLRMSCEWSPDKNFLIRELKAGPTADRLSLLGTQRIGWDPISGRIKSWLFEADGGWGDGFWVRAGDGWDVRASVVHPDGTHATATTRYAPLDADHIRLESTDITVGGQTRPDVKLDFYRSRP